MRKTSFALIGVGVVGERIINQLLNSETCEIISIYDENKARLQEVATKYELPVAQSVDALFETKPDWVYIGTPPVSHASLAEQAAKHGLNILSEKPLAHNVEDGEKMVASATKAEVHTAMHFPMMYSPVVHQLKEALREDELGEIVRIELHTYFPVWPRPWQQNPWIATREQGGFIREVFPHYLQVMHYLFGDLTILSHEVSYPEDVEHCETGVSALAKTTSGIPVLLNGLSGIGQKERLEFKVFGTAKVMTIRNWSELWVSEVGQEEVQVIPDVKPLSLIDSCCGLLSGEEVLTVPFEEGLKVQKWIDELLSN
ncbi:Gfo/Idh/MocA family protein [Ureibacillus manganicus]|uniref:Dehydrogenase n=1 Tax=Ureibacillus manganicus DSM 26584 TaxID=1384049 RepID=A0A0A3I7F5_9BACL|nr:Gfo/Idh/MocA family oxidoreductase [Ureibacillus manganicus]KGR79440.1 dehydrogenase [Ureibacillus manganicus DSM 26584]